MEAPLLYGHVAVRLQNYVLFFAGTSGKYRDIRHFIWSYNLHTEQWREYRIPESKTIPHIMATDSTSAVAIGTDVYLFGCAISKFNDVWRLTINKNRYFTWTKMSEKPKSETPSPRTGHSAWEYMEKMWIFGGHGISPSYGFLYKHGYANGNFNNQLLCYDPCNNTWTNPKCFGDVPCPRKRHATALITDKVFLYGGYLSDSLDCFLMMNMDSLFWTLIKTNGPNPGPRCGMFLIAVTANQLVLSGGYDGHTSLSAFNVPWIFDIEDRMWKPHRQFKDRSRQYHTGTRGLTSSVFIVDGCGTWNEPTSHLLLEPKSLQQLAMHTIYQHRNMLPLKSLPSRIMNQLMDPAQDEEPDF